MTSRMRKVVVVAIREYLDAVKSKAFILTIVLMPILATSGIIAEKVLKGRADTTDKRIAIVDRTGVLYQQLEAAAAIRNETEIFEQDETSGEKRQTAPRFELEQVTPDEGTRTDALLVRLSDRVRDGELFAFVVIGENVLQAQPSDEVPAVEYYSNTPTYRDVRRWLSSALTLAVQQWRFRQSGLDAEKVAWALQPAEVESIGLVKRDAQTGQIVPGEKVDQVATVLIPLLMVVLMMMVVLMGATPLIQSVLEEKGQRIAEVLLGSIAPFPWMIGKLIGMVAVSLTVVAVYAAGGVFVASRYDVLQHVPFHLVGWFATYQILAVIMFGAMFIAAGAACTDHREAQSIVTPIMLVIMFPMLVLQQVVREPASGFALAVSLFPPATPMVMLTRQAVPPGIPLWQPMLGIVVMLAGTVLCVFAASRILRVGILMQGRGAGLRDVMRWMITG